MVDANDLTDPDAGRTFGVDAEGTNYPFVRLTEQTNNLLSDFYLSYKDGTKVGPFRISALYNFDRPLGLAPAPGPGQNQSDLIVVDANNSVVCDTATAQYVGRPFGRFYIHEWVGEGYVCRAVQHRTFPEDLLEATRATEQDEDRITEQDEERILEQLPSPVPASLTLTDGQLDERTYHCLNERVDRLIVNGEEIEGDVRFVEGFNVSFGAESPLPTFLFDAIAVLAPRSAMAVLPTSSITVSAIAGAGQGTAPGCIDREPGIRYINNRGPDSHGNFLLEGDECIYVRLDTNNLESGNPVLRPHQLKIGNSCTACRRCSDYVDVYEMEREVNDLILSNRTRLQAVKTGYTSLRSDWIAFRTCTQSDYVKLVASAISYPNTAAEDEPDNSETFLSIAAWLNNPRNTCMTGSLQFTGPGGGSQYGAGVTISGNGTLTGGGIGSIPSTVNFGTILPGKTAMVACAIRYAPQASGTLCARPIIAGVDPTTHQVCTGF